jgi:hypothetical protein
VGSPPRSTWPATATAAHWRFWSPPASAMRAPSSGRCWMPSGSRAPVGRGDRASGPRTWSPTAATATRHVGGCCAGGGSPTPSPSAPTSSRPGPAGWSATEGGSDALPPAQRGRAGHRPAQAAPGDCDQVRQAGRQLSQLAGPGRPAPLAPGMSRQTGPSCGVPATPGQGRWPDR